MTCMPGYRSLADGHLQDVGRPNRFCVPLILGSKTRKPLPCLSSKGSYEISFKSFCKDPMRVWGFMAYIAYSIPEGLLGRV